MSNTYSSKFTLLLASIMISAIPAMAQPSRGDQSAAVAETQNILDAQQEATRESIAERDANMAQAYAEWTKQLNAKQAADEAARKNEWDTALNKINSDADDALKKLNQQYLPAIKDWKNLLDELNKNEAGLKVQEEESARINNLLLAKQLYQPADPWRVLNGKICNAKDTNWYQFTGTVLDIKTNRILIWGSFGLPFEAASAGQKYYVNDFPVGVHPISRNQEITTNMNYAACMIGKTTNLLSDTSIDMEVAANLDYGQILKTKPPPDLALKWETKVTAKGGPSPDIELQIGENEKQMSSIEQKISDNLTEYNNKSLQIEMERDSKIRNLPVDLAAQLKAREDIQKRMETSRVLQIEQEQADKGDPSALRRMAERYRDGDGVEEDTAKANEYFKKAEEAEKAAAQRKNEENQLKAQAASQEKFARNLALADNGDVDCMVNVGKSYRDGDGVDKDTRKAREYFQKATDAGSQEAARLLDELQ